MFKGRYAAAFVALVVAWSVQPVPAAGSPCPGGGLPEWVPGQGLSCRVAGGWLVLLRDGSTIETHGPDPAPPARVGLLAAPDPPPCVGNPATQHHHRAVYARPSDKPDRHATMAPTIRGLIHEANGLLLETGLAQGAATEYPFRCAGGVVEVANAALATPSGADTFSTIVSDLQALGFASSLAKYWVWYDDAITGCPGCAGQGSLNDDDAPGSGNANNVGPDYGVSYGFADMLVMMHENGHNMGAVQNSAPHTSGAFHCNDGQDIMCYADGGPLSAYNPNVCPALRFDCNGNDYFHANPPGGSYLATHWNLGSAVNRFLQVGIPPGAPSPPLDVAVTAGPGGGELTVTWSPPADPGASALTAYRLYRGTTSGSLSFLAQTGTGLSHTDGGLPAGATRWYAVAAVNGHGEGERSAVASGRTFSPPGDARNLMATGEPKRIHLMWSPPFADGGTPVTSYDVFRGTTATSQGFLVNVPGGGTVYDDEGLADGQRFFYKVRAVNAAGASPLFSNVANARTDLPPTAPPTLRASTGPGLGQVTLTWTAPLDDGGDPITGYVVYRGVRIADGAEVARVGNVLTHVDTVPRTDLYNYRVAATNGVGDGARTGQAFALGVGV